MRPRSQMPGGGQGPDAAPQTVKAVVLIAVVVLVGVLLLHHSPGSTTSTASATTAKAPPTTASRAAAAPTTTTTLIAPAAIKVLVLNGADFTKPLASQWGAKLKTSFGYNVVLADNATTRVAASSIYMLTTGLVPEAQHLAQQVGLPPTAVNPTVGGPPTAPIPPRDKTNTNLVLVVGPELVASA